jgi:hypothetical protein
MRSILLQLSTAVALAALTPSGVAAADRTLGEVIEHVGARTGPLATATLLRIIFGEVTNDEGLADFDAAIRQASRGEAPAGLEDALARLAPAYIDAVESYVVGQARWPGDAAPEIYLGQALIKLEVLRSLLAADLDRSRDPVQTLRGANEVLAWTVGEREVYPMIDHFAVHDELAGRAAESLDLGPEPTRPENP